MEKKNKAKRLETDNEKNELLGTVLGDLLNSFNDDNDDFKKKVNNINNVVKSYKSKLDRSLLSTQVEIKQQQQAALISASNKKDAKETIKIKNINALLDDASSVYKRNNSLYSVERDIGGTLDPLANIYSVEDLQLHSEGIRLYRSLDVMNKVIASPIDLALKNPMELKFYIEDEAKEKEINKYVKGRFDELNWGDKLRQALFYMSISSYGTVMLPITDNEASSVAWGGEDILGINVIPDYAFFYVHYASYNDAWRLNYDKPREFYIGGRLTEQSRFYWCVNNFDVVNGRGESILARNLESIRALNLALVGFSHMILDLHRKVLYMSNPEGISKVQTDVLKKTLETLRQTANNDSALVMPPGYDMKHLNVSLGQGMTDIIKFFWDMAGANSDQTGDFFKGSALGQIASAEKNERQIFSAIRSNYQKRHVVPITKFFVNLLLREQAAQQIYDKEIKFDVIIPPMHEDTEEEKLRNKGLELDNALKQSNLELFGEDDMKDKGLKEVGT